MDGDEAANAQLLDNVTQAIESDGSSIDLGRVNGLLARADDAKPSNGQLQVHAV